jgi:hypothetical protein
MQHLARVILAGVLMTGAGEARAYNLMGNGIVSCGTWTVDRQHDRAATLEQWVFGFLSGIGYWGAAQASNPLNGMDAEGVFVWIDNYCRTHPISQLVEAAGAFNAAHPR